MRRIEMLLDRDRKVNARIAPVCHWRKLPDMAYLHIRSGMHTSTMGTPSNNASRSPSAIDTTVMFVDVVESVRLIEAGEWAAVQRIKDFLARGIDQAVRPYRGHVVERRGDGLLLRFAGTGDAVACATALHRLAATESAAHPTEPPVQLRAGLYRGEVLDDGQALYGMAVNLAARIAALAQPGSTLLSATCRDDLNGELDGPFEDIGPCWLKHVEEPVRLFRLPARTLALPGTIEQAISARMRLKPTLLLLPTAAPGEGASPDSTGLEQVVTDRLTRAFCRSPMLHVISPMSARSLRGRQLEQAELYRRFRADYLLQTSLVTPSAAEARGEPVRLRASLWRRGAAEPVWSDESSGTALDALSAESSLLGRLVEGVGKRILNVEQRLAQHSQVLPNLASHTLYLNAVDQLHRFSTAAFENSQRLLLALHERAPRHAEPLAWLARWHVFKVVQGWSVDSHRDGMMALDYSHRALDSDPASALALTMAGSVYAGVKRDAATAQSLYAQALTHDPNDSLAWLMSGVAQGFLNEGEPALAASETALGLAPVDPTRHYYDSLSATTALRAGQYERCVALAQRAIQANTTHGSAYRSQAIAEWLLGRPADSKRTVQRLLGVEPHFTVQHFRARVPEQDPRRDAFAQILSAAGLPAD